MSRVLWNARTAPTHQIDRSASRRGDSLCGGVEKGDPRMEKHIWREKKEGGGPHLPRCFAKEHGNLMGHIGNYG